MALVGASIGANYALRALAADEKLRGAVLLSPGLDYHGVTAADRVLKALGEMLKPAAAEAQALDRAL